MAISKQRTDPVWEGRRLSLEEFLALPEGETPLEFDDGVVTQKVAPQGDHGRIQFKLGGVFERAGELAGLGLVFTETRFKTPTWAPVPDISFYLRERLPQRSDEQIGDLDQPPDIAVEISSPDQSLGALFTKCQRYAALGVRVTLLVAVEDRTVFLFHPDRQPAALRGADRIDFSGVLPDVSLTVDGLFAMIRPPWAAPGAMGESTAPTQAARPTPGQ